MNLLVICKKKSDFTDVLDHLSINVTYCDWSDSATFDVHPYDGYCLLSEGGRLDPRVREKLEKENIDGGKKIFADSLRSFLNMYSDHPVDTSKKRLICVGEGENAISGLEFGDLLDDMANYLSSPYFSTPEISPLLVYKDFVIAHDHTNMSKEEIFSGAQLGMWKYGPNVIMTSFRLHNFNKARFAPRENWQNLIKYIINWLTGFTPEWMPEPVIHHNLDLDYDNDDVFESQRKKTIDEAIKWIEQFLIDEGRGGMLDGFSHNIDPEGLQARLDTVRADYIGETAGIFRMYSDIYGDTKYRRYSENMYSFNYGPMLIKDGMFKGFLRWSYDGWGVCYQDDVARATMYDLLHCVVTGERNNTDYLKMILDYFVKITGKDGLLPYRHDILFLNEESFSKMCESEHGEPSAHYNAYYSAIMLLGYQLFGDSRYFEIGTKGLETIMNLYPETSREQSETEEICRLILPLAILYHSTRKEEHKQMLYRVVDDLETHRHSFGGYTEWDTGYKARFSRNSRTECSILTENGDPVADLFYALNWTSMGFAYAYYATGEKRFKDLWRNITVFWMRTQAHCENPLYNGGWCRAFDMNRQEIYGCPHDAGWAACCMSPGWATTQILGGMMFFDFVEKYRK
ncbi:MAG: hypothetical protein E7672_09075 [Ruminococcaceae bacterium]|nr:hypothetical protein [Oscillospiraceae bacterium]